MYEYIYINIGRPSTYYTLEIISGALRIAGG